MQSKILMEDEQLLVCFKPVGLAVQSGRVGEMDMVSELRNYLAATTGSSYLGLVHRLDQPVSGIMVFAKTPQAAADLSRQAAKDAAAKDAVAKDAAAKGAGARGMEKEYRGLVYLQGANPPLQEGARLRLTDDLLRDGRLNRSRVAAPGTEGAKRSSLEVGLLQRGGGEEQKHGLVAIRLLTGRHHQIRVQLSHAGLPLLGDGRYGSPESQAYSARLGLRSVCLCAFRLCFIHPATGKRLEFCMEELPWRIG